MVGFNFYDLQYPEPLATNLQVQIQEVIDTAGPVRAETAFGDGYYEYIFVPIFGEDGAVTSVAGTTREISERRRTELALERSRAEAERLVAELRVERENLTTLFERAPAFIATFTGPDFVFQFANEAYYRLIGEREIIGKPIREALPEIEEQGFIKLLDQVYRTGNTFIGRGVRVMLIRDGTEPDERFVDFNYQALKNSDGFITGIFVHGVDVTEEILARKEVERLNAELELRVEERTRELQIANRDLEGFTYSVSHDLRAPLRAIVSSSSILIEDFGAELSDGAQSELRRQAAAAGRMAVLIDELLKLSRLGRQELRRKPIDLTEMVKSVASEISARSAKPFYLNVEDGMCTVGDATSLRLLLLNLVENADKFSPEEALIVVGSHRQEDETVFWVKDCGVGFDMQYADKVFQPFERLVRDEEFPGTGIGLANVKRIVERHGGRVWVDSEPGSGTTVFFTLGKGAVVG